MPRIVQTSAPMAMTATRGTNSRNGKNSSTPSSSSGRLASMAIITVIWKLSTSLAWGTTSGSSSFFTCQMTSGTMMLPNGMMPPLSPPTWQRTGQSVSGRRGAGGTGSEGGAGGTGGGDIGGGSV